MYGLYDRHLDALIAAAETGSFSKAASLLFISPNALIKQVNLLEADVGARLFDRSARGVTLTEAGRVVYEGAKDVIAKTQAIVERARYVSGARPSAVRLATSVLRPFSVIGQAWERVEGDHPGMRVEIIQIPDDPDGWNAVFSHLGDKVDVAGAIKPSSGWDWYERCQVHSLYSENIIVQVPRKHRLARSGAISPSDLAGETLMLAERGAAPDFDELRAWLERELPRTKIVDVRPYDLDSGNLCIENGWLCCVPASWATIHPSMVGVPVLWDFTLTQTLVCPKHPRPAVQEFVDAVVRQFRPAS